MRFPYDNKDYVKNNLNLSTGYHHCPDIEEFWEDCNDGYEVKRRDWIRLS